MCACVSSRLSSSRLVPLSQFGSSNLVRFVSSESSACMWMCELLMPCKSNLPGGMCGLRLRLPCVCVCVCAAIKSQHKLQSFSHRFTHTHTPLGILLSQSSSSFLSVPSLSAPLVAQTSHSNCYFQPVDELTSVIVPLSLRCHLHHGSAREGGREDGGPRGLPPLGQGKTLN